VIIIPDDRQPPLSAGHGAEHNYATPQATIRAAIIAAIKDAGYLHILEGRRAHTTPAEALSLHDLD